jgi:ABC-type molybdate transport system substrate-binding protein
VAASATQGPLVGETVARGEAELGIQPITELMEVQGIDVVGPLPAELQSPDLVYVAGVPYLSEQPILAKALIDFLTDPKAAPDRRDVAGIARAGGTHKIWNRKGLR